jgi:sn-glycerol 3-phosphate transport system ATP-binding protein
MRDEIRSLQQKLGLTMVYVTHDQVEAMTMADQVVLLQQGRVEQIGPPHALYESPRTVFAAQFLGSPPMNLVSVDRVQDRAALAAACGGRLPADCPPEGFIGVRPEDVHVGAQGLPVRVVAVDYLGAETVVRMAHDGQALFARLDGRRNYTAGEALHISWSNTAVHCFGADGISIEGAAKATA